jgi:hypothetical protein
MITCRDLTGTYIVIPAMTLSMPVLIMQGESVVI